MQAVPVTAYGRRFRSTTEARWATFLTELRIAWEYEPETFDLGPLGWYMPDFWIPEAKLFLEVKHSGELELAAIEKVRALARVTDRRVAIAHGFGMPTTYDWPVPGFDRDDPGWIEAYGPQGRVSGQSFTLCICRAFGLEFDYLTHLNGCSEDRGRPLRAQLLDAYEAGASFRADSR
jgi:hypothetical protein